MGSKEYGIIPEEEQIHAAALSVACFWLYPCLC